MTEVKACLNQWASKRYLRPKYDMSAVNAVSGVQFCCELTLPGFDYVGFGRSTSKKSAMTIAARDFCLFLVREGQMDPSLFSIPADTNVHDGLAACSLSSVAPNTSNSSQKVATANSRAFCITEPKHSENVSEPVDASAKTAIPGEDCGGWTLENSKQGLNQYLQTSKLKNFAYEYTSSGPPHRAEFIAEASLPVPERRITVHASGKGSSKKQASACCALSLVHQLYKLGVVKKVEEATQKKKLEIPVFDVFIPSVLDEDISNYLSAEGVDYVETKPGLAENVSLIANVQDECSEPMVDQLMNSVQWSPSTMNFNPWTCRSIEDGEWFDMTMEEISASLLAQRIAREAVANFKLMQNTRKELPVFASKEKILDAVRYNSVTLIVGETGCGKTTQVCQYVLDSMLFNRTGASCNIIVTQPRRISAITVAERVAVERGEKLGQSVGYHVRFDSHFPSPYGSIMFCTVGVLLRRMESGLRGISHIIVDEVHERDLDTDFLLIILRDLVPAYPSLRVILMSATINPSSFEQYFSGCATVHIDGRLFPVSQYFLEDAVQMTNFANPENPYDSLGDDKANWLESGNAENLNANVSSSYPESVRTTVAMMSENECHFELIEAIIVHQVSRGLTGSVLIFLPGWSIIVALQRFLESRLPEAGIKCVLLPLHSQLPKENQFQVFDPVPSGFTKIILATNIAESSVTISDVVMVIDSCKAKMKRYTSYNNMVHYVTTWASKSNLQQRCGRAGRCQPGICFHLCSRARLERLDEYSQPEMLRSPLHEMVLAVKLLRLGSSLDFLNKAMQPPPIDAIIEAEMVLRDIGALNKDSQLTALGRILAHLPIDPVFGKAIVLGTLFSIGDVMCSIAALSSFIEPYVVPVYQRRLSDMQRSFTGTRFSDHVALLEIYQCFLAASNYGIQSERDFCRSYGINAPLLRTVFEATHQLKNVLQSFGFSAELLQLHRVCVNGLDYRLDLMTSLLVAALYPNVCWHCGKRRVLTLENTTALIHKHSVNCEGQYAQFPSPFFVFSEKMRTAAVSCRQLSMVTHVQLLLFGSRSIELCDGLVVLDNWLKLRMSPVTAAKIVALRRCVDRLVGRMITANGVECNFTATDRTLVHILARLSVMHLGYPQQYIPIPRRQLIQLDQVSFEERKRMWKRAAKRGRFDKTRYFGDVHGSVRKPAYYQFR
uniref:RNA helicase n=1 Tax=Trichuris muris TaxID=70415 RepID=A0A5S6QX75_TRIMR